MVANFTTSALQSALQGLNVAQQLIDVTSQNVSSASTPGYTTKTLGVSDLVAGGGQVIGVQTGDIQRSVDENLQKTVWQETSTSNNQSTISTALANMQSTYGTATAGTNFSSYLSTLQDDFTQLSATPSNTTLQSQTVADAKTFANNLNSTAQGITTARNDAESGIASSVTSINADLQTIATLNTQIVSATVSGTGGAADLEDQRDQAISSLSQQMAISTYTSANGVVVVQTASGQLLANTQANTLVFQTQPIGTDSTYPTNLGGVYINSATTGYDLASNTDSVGGVLGANLQLRDQILPQQQAQLDELAEQTANRFSAQGLTLFSQADGTIPTNSPGDYVGFASTIQVNPIVTANPSYVQQGTPTTPPSAALDSGDATIINNVLNYTFGLDSSAGTANTPFNTTGLGASGTISIAAQLPSVATLGTFATDIMSTQAGQASQYSSQSTTSGNYLATLQTNLSNSTQVNLDTQVANLTVYQNAYSCAAQVISTEQTMMTDLLTAVQDSTTS